MDIKPHQIRAAMAHLNITVKDLAEKSGVNHKTIGFLREDDPVTTPKQVTKDKVVGTLEDLGAEFIPNGARLNEDTSVKTLYGLEGFETFMRDVRAHASRPGVDICVSGVNESLFEKWQGQGADLHITTMNSLHDQYNFDFRILVEEGDDNYTAGGYAQYREVPSENFFPSSTYIYADKKAEIVFKPDDVTIIIIENADLASSARKTFNIVWNSIDE